MHRSEVKVQRKTPQAVMAQPQLDSGSSILLKPQGLVWKRGQGKWIQRTLLSRWHHVLKRNRRQTQIPGLAQAVSHWVTLGRLPPLSGPRCLYLWGEVIGLVPGWCPRALTTWKCPNTTITKCLVRIQRRLGFQPRIHREDLSLPSPLCHPRTPCPLQPARAAGRQPETGSQPALASSPLQLR